jgi:hypothetical protein
MEKPTEPRLTTDGAMDYDLAERVVRQLQESSLHVVASHVTCSLPGALAPRARADEHAFMMFDLAMITDGRRGWLILVDEAPEYDAAAEMTELFTEIVGGPAADAGIVVRGATMDHLDPCYRAHTLDLRDPTRVRGDVERAYEDAFRERDTPVDHDALVTRLRQFDYEVRDERALREELAGNG